MQKIQEKPWRLLHNLAISAIVLIILEYISGMWLNIYTGAEGDANLASELTHSPIMSIHIYISLALLVNTLAILIIATKFKIKNWTAISAISIVSVLLAANQGFSFLNDENNLASFLMSLSFIVAFSINAYGLIINKHNLPIKSEDDDSNL